MMECFECGAPAEEDHHVIPQSLGGVWTRQLLSRLIKADSQEEK